MEGNEVEGLELIEPTRRRRHSREFKEKVVRAALQPNVPCCRVWTDAHRGWMSQSVG